MNQEAVSKFPVYVQVLLVLVCMALQLFVIYRIIDQGININFGTRRLYTRQVGLSYRLLSLSLPNVALSYGLFLKKRSVPRSVLLLCSLTVSSASAVYCAQRMFLVLIPIIVLLMYVKSKPRKLGKGSVYAMSFAVLVLIMAISVGYMYSFRSIARKDFEASLRGTVMGDLGRSHTLAYTVQHARAWSSELVSPPILSSYLHWAILPIPRAYWPEKPWPANLQFSHSFHAEHSHYSVPYFIADMSGQNEFGFIEESVLNLGVIGLAIIMVITGFSAGRADKVLLSLHSQTTLFLFFLLGTIYSFNAVVMLLAPLLIVSLVADAVAGRALRIEHRLVGNTNLDSAGYPCH